MIIRSFAVLFLLINFGLTATPSKDKSEPTISECAAKGGECDELKGRPVCGTDDQTYPTRCHLIRVQCSGHQVSLKHRGPCKECLEARAYALKHKTYNKYPARFVPKCRDDGTYAQVQCLEANGCWCSDSAGKPIANTSVRSGRPNCKKFARTNIRRSPPRHVTANRNRRQCTQSDQALFNANLIKAFQSEYTRVHLRRDAVSSSATSSALNDKIVLDWKFSQLDGNANHMLDKHEFRELKQLVKKVIKPKRCARAFGKFCDINEDDRLSRLEWSCLSPDGINRLKAGQSIHPSTDLSSIPHHQTHHNHNSNSNSNPLPIHMDNDDDDDSSQHEYEYDSTSTDDYDPEDADSSDDDNIRINSFGSMASSPPVTQFPSIHFLRSKIIDPEPVLRESEGESDCLSDRASALENQGNTALYVPECTTDGRYQRVQCYRSTGYCWCVHEDTGKNIPGTSVKDKRPQCDSIYPLTRPMKGCPEPKKIEFLRDLKEFLKMQVGSNGNTGVNTTNWTSEDQKIATLSFVLLDKNKNKVWERKEWKTFRELVTASKPLRKCGKKMPRYCDVNSDKKITLSEWLNCIQAQGVEALLPLPAIPAIASTSKPLNGRNPLDSYLKE